MTVYFNTGRNRWMYNFKLGGKRYAGYCRGVEGKPVTSRSAARQAESVQRHRVVLEPKVAATEGVTLAMVMADLMPVWQQQAHWTNKRRYMKKILEFFGPATPVADIDAGRVADYVRHLQTSPTRSWQGGPDRDPNDPEFAKFWVTGQKPRSPATSNLYLTMLRQTLARAAQIRDPVTGKPAIDHAHKVPELSVPKRKARPIPDSVLSDIIKAVPQHVAEASVLTLYFGFRRGEVFNLRIHHVDFEAGGIRLFAEGVKDKEDTFLPGAPEAMEYLRRLVEQAKGRGVTHLITWRRRRNAPTKQKLEPWRPLKRPKSAWKTVMRQIEVSFGRRFRWHDLRSAFITQVAMTSGPLAAQALARHSDYETTKAYVEVADEFRRTAAERAADRPALSAITGAAKRIA